MYMPNKADVKYDVPSEVTSIAEEAFSGCGLQAVTIGANVSEIGYGAFNDCSYLSNIDVRIENQYYSSENRILFDKNKTKLIKCPENAPITEYSI